MSRLAHALSALVAVASLACVEAIYVVPEDEGPLPQESGSDTGDPPGDESGETEDGDGDGEDSESETESGDTDESDAESEGSESESESGDSEDSGDGDGDA